MELLFVREVASRLGVSDAAVRKAIISGRIKALPGDSHPDNGRQRLRWPEVADQWEKNGNSLRRTHIGPRKEGGKRAEYAGEPVVTLETVGQKYGSEDAPARKNVPVFDDTDDDDAVYDDLPRTATVAEARAYRERFEALQARIKYDKEIGKLVDTADVKKQAFKLARGVRDAMMNIPDRVSHELAAQTDPARVHQRLTEEIRQALADLAGEGEPE